jgi:hypothetical protein
MGIIGAHIVAFMTVHLLVADPDICLDIFHQMSYVDRAIGIWQGTGYQYFSVICSHSSHPVYVARKLSLITHALKGKAAEILLLQRPVCPDPEKNLYAGKFRVKRTAGTCRISSRNSLFLVAY